MTLQTSPVSAEDALAHSCLTISFTCLMLLKEEKYIHPLSALEKTRLIC